MNAVTLRAILARELAAVGITDPGERRGLGATRITLWSPVQPGFGTRCYPSGKRVYAVQVRMDGTPRTVTICNAAFISETVALDVARRVILRAQVGENPAETRRRVRARPLFDVFMDRYWQQALPRWKASTRETNGIYRRQHLDGAFADKGIDEIEEADVAAWYARVADSAGPGAANRTLAILSAMMNRAEQSGYRPEGSNPCRPIRRYRGRKVERHLSEGEMARVGEVLARRRDVSPVHTAALSLLMLTGCRRSEIIGLTWDEVKGRRLRLHDSKTGARTIWLGAEARAIIDAIPRRKGAQLVFPNARTGRAITLDDFWRSVREEAGLAHARLHDLRHSFASWAAGMSETLPMIGKLLGHASVSTTARYAHLDDADAVEAARQIGCAIEATIAA